MNLKEFKIKHEAEDHYIMQHPQGKEFTVKKKGLNEKSRMLINGLQKFAEGTPAGTVGDYASSPELNITPPEGMRFDPVSGQYVDTLSPMAEAPTATGRDAAAKYFLNDQSALQPTPANSEAIIRDAPVVGRLVDNPQGIGDTATAQNPQPNEMNNNSGNSSGDFKATEGGQPVDTQSAQSQDPASQKASGVIKALQEQSVAQAGIGNEEAAQHLAEAKDIQTAQDKVDTMATQQQILQANKAKDDAFATMLQSQSIDPNRYYKNQSTGEKIGQGIALVLGGIGSGLTGQPNAALGLLKDRIDQDIEAQKNDQSKTLNLWKMNREALGNDLAANLATQNQLYTGLKYNLMKEAAKAASPIAKYRSQLAVAEIDQQIGMQQRKLSLLQQGMGLGLKSGQFSGNDPSPLVNELVPPAQQAKAFEEIGTAQYISKTYGQILNAFDQASKEQRFMAKPGMGTAINSLVPGVHSGSIDHLSTLLGPTFKQVEGTVRQAAMDNVFNHTFPQAFDNDKKIAEKRQGLIDYLTSEDHYPVLKGNYINPEKFQSTHIPESIQLVRGSDGNMYKKVQGGYEKVK